MTTDNVDDLQALNTALCFLCSINAEAKVVETFLVSFPAALVLEGTNDESAHSILQEHIRNCHCNTGCNPNRIKLLELIGKGFPHYHERHMKEKSKRLEWSSSSRQEVTVLEREIRQLRWQDVKLRQQLLEKESQPRGKKRFRLLACLLYNKKSGLTCSRHLSVECARLEILRKIQHRRRMQFHALKTALGSCQRHVCGPN
jgi:hypothetical protein